MKFAMVLMFTTTTAVAQKPDWQIHIDWAIQNRTGPDEVNCPAEYEKTGTGCLTNGGRACLMQAAISAAQKRKDFDLAFRLTLITQCHNQGAQRSLQDAGRQNVGEYLSAK